MTPFAGPMSSNGIRLAHNLRGVIVEGGYVSLR